jgi:hypothetical protein
VPAAGAVDSLLVFLTTSCVTCQDHWAKLGAVALGTAGAAHLVVVTPSRSMEDEPLARSLTPAGAHLHMSSDTWFMYGVGQAGTSVLVRSPQDGPPPWAEAGQVLGSALPAELGELPELVHRWQGQAPSVAGAGGGPHS